MPSKKKYKKPKIEKINDPQSDITLMQQAFVTGYVTHFDGKRAAIEAGYSEKSAATLSSQLLNNSKIQKAISEALDKHALKYDVLKKRVLDQLANIAFSDITDYQQWSGDYATLKDSESLSKAQRAAIHEVKVTTITKEDSATHKVELKLCSKEKALELIGRHLGMFNDKLEVKKLVPMVIDYGDGSSTVLTAKEE